MGISQEERQNWQTWPFSVKWLCFPGVGGTGGHSAPFPPEGGPHSPSTAPFSTSHPPGAPGPSLF